MRLSWFSRRARGLVLLLLLAGLLLAGCAPAGEDCSLRMVARVPLQVQDGLLGGSDERSSAPEPVTIGAHDADRFIR